MRNDKLLRLVTAAVLAALACVATMVVSVPIPATKGYFNLGDCIVLICGLFLGPVYGALAGGLGSALADLFLGYAVYAPGTFLIKGCMALFAALIFRALQKKTKFAAPVAVVPAALWMAAGYFLYESTLLGYGMAALGSVPANLLQGAVGAVAAAVLFHALRAVPAIRRFIEK